jgi:alpha-L-fucosidase 2
MKGERMKRLLVAWIVTLICIGPVCAGDLMLWYDKPANTGMNEALPIGNGKLGGLVYAGPEQERVVLNEISLWTGTEISDDDYSKMGWYEMLGELLVNVAPDVAAGPVQNYRRSLDLATAVHTVSYRSGAVTFQREAFASHPDQVMVLRFSADRPGACTGTVQLQGAHKETTTAAGTSLAFTGTLENGLKYEAKLVALNDGGTLQAEDGKLEFKNCNNLTLLVAAGTDYALDYARHYRGENPHAAIEKRLAAAAAKQYDDLKAAHVAEYKTYFNRVALDGGVALPIWPLPDDLLLPARRAAGQFAGIVE